MIVNAALLVSLKLAFEPSPATQVSSWNVLGLNVVYPLGFSFVILMMHSAVTDAYSGRYVPKRSASTFALFAIFFPYVSAGPVERLNHMEAQLEAPNRPSFEDLRQGVSLIALGLVKKLVAANRIQYYVEAIFNSKESHSVVTVLLAICLNAAYVYSDFSGYTDIARGAARCVGIDVSINFAKPFAARSVTEFWRRWHISFSSWLRDYLYMPLGFTLRRFGKTGSTIALLVTFVLCGFWHRAAFTFLLFGLLHGAVMVVEERFSGKGAAAVSALPNALRTAAAHTYTLIFLFATIVLFSAKDLGEAGAIFARLFTSPLKPSAGEALAFQGPVSFLFLIAGIAAWMGLQHWRDRLKPRDTDLFLLCAAVAVLFLGSPIGGGFVYARF